MGTSLSWSFLIKINPLNTSSHSTSFPVIEISVWVFAWSFVILYGELKVGQTWDSWNISTLIAGTAFM